MGRRTDKRSTTARSASRPITRWDRAGALSGAAYVLLILVGNAIATGNGSQSNDPTGQQVLTYLEKGAHSTAAQVGGPMETLGFVALAFFIAWLVPFLRRAGGPAPWLANVALVGGIGTLAVKIGSVAPELALQAERDHLTPATARVVYAIAGAGFVISFLTFAILMLGIGASVLSSGALGRVAGWTAVLLGAAGFVVVATTGSIDANPLPFLLGLLWILVVSVRLGWRGPRPVRASQPTVGVAVGA
jgi:hypothetical protein